MFQLLKHCLVKQPAEEDPDEGIKELVEIMKTGKIMDDEHSTFWMMNVLPEPVR